MTKPRSDLRRALGRLVSAIQKEESLVSGHDTLWRPATEARERAEALLAHAATPTQLVAALAGRSLIEYVGVRWLSDHPSVRPAVANVLSKLRASV